MSKQDGPTGALYEGKLKHPDNPFVDSGQRQTMVDMKGGSNRSVDPHELHSLNLFADVMVLNDIIEQAAGRQSGGSDHGGKRFYSITPSPLPCTCLSYTPSQCASLVLLRKSSHTSIARLNVSLAQQRKDSEVAIRVPNSLITNSNQPFRWCICLDKTEAVCGVVLQYCFHATLSNHHASCSILC